MALLRRLAAAFVICLPVTWFVPASAQDCPLTRQRSFDSIVDRLREIAANPTAVGQMERICFVSIASQIAGWYPPALSGVASTMNADVRAALAKASPAKSPDNALTSPETYTALVTELAKRCHPETRLIPASALTREQALTCGLIQLPGAPRGLGNFTAKAESGNVIGGFDAVSADPQAGGWTYGRYQLASQAGGISGFLAALTCPTGHSPCLHESFRGVGQALEQAGGLQGAKKEGSAFAKRWVELARTERAMQQAQEAYQALDTWMPMTRFFSDELGIDLNTMSCGLREAVFSIRTQHQTSSTKQIFSEAVKVAGKTDSAAIVKAANEWRLGRLGEPGGYYVRYGDICLRNAPATSKEKDYACAYLAGVRKRWTSEGPALAKLNAVDCPQGQIGRAHV